MCCSFAHACIALRGEVNELCSTVFVIRFMFNLILKGVLLMYENTGRKIKHFANTLMTISCILTLVIAIGVFVIMAGASEGGLGFFLALIICAIGFLISWLTFLLLAGFGELIEETRNTRIALELLTEELEGANNAQKIHKTKPEQEPSEPDPDKVGKEAPRTCPFCGHELDNGYCAKCDMTF